MACTYCAREGGHDHMFVEKNGRRLEDDIVDEVGNLMGKLTTDFLDERSEIESELTGYAFDRINSALLGEIKKSL